MKSLENKENVIKGLFEKEEYLFSLSDVLFRNKNEELYQLFNKIENIVNSIKKDIDVPENNVIDLSGKFKK